jgi:hypothetical protein
MLLLVYQCIVASLHSGQRVEPRRQSQLGENIYIAEEKRENELAMGKKLEKMVI